MYKIGLVVDRSFGEKLSQLAKEMHIWVCDSDFNRQVAEKIWKDISHDLEKGVTVFDVRASETEEEMILNQIDNIDMHHGQHAQKPVWECLEVYGIHPTSKVVEGLKKHGEGRIENTENGFKFLRCPALANNFL